LKSKLIVGTMALGLLVCGSSFGQTPAPQKSPDADNTKVNKRDRSKAEPTADNAKENVSDRDIMQKIRKAVVADKSLSTNAHNVKIIAEHGKVTLKGPVNSEEEKKNIEQKATDVAGAGNVTDEITIKTTKKSS